MNLGFLRPVAYTAWNEQWNFQVFIISLVISTSGKKRLSILYDQTKKKRGGAVSREERMVWRVKAHSSNSHPNIHDGQGVKLVMGLLSHQEHMWPVSQSFETHKSGVYKQCGNNSDSEQNFSQEWTDFQLWNRSSYFEHTISFSYSFCERCKHHLVPPPFSFFFLSKSLKWKIKIFYRYLTSKRKTNTERQWMFSLLLFSLRT